MREEKWKKLNPATPWIRKLSHPSCLLPLLWIQKVSHEKFRYICINVISYHTHTQTCTHSHTVGDLVRVPCWRTQPSAKGWNHRGGRGTSAYVQYFMGFTAMRLQLLPFHVHSTSFSSFASSQKLLPEHTYTHTSPSKLIALGTVWWEWTTRWHPITNGTLFHALHPVSCFARERSGTHTHTHGKWDKTEVGERESALIRNCNDAVWRF